jgi:hypothetical protein
VTKKPLVDAFNVPCGGEYTVRFTSKTAKSIGVGASLSAQLQTSITAGGGVPGFGEVEGQIQTTLGIEANMSANMEWEDVIERTQLVPGPENAVGKAHCWCAYQTTKVIEISIGGKTILTIPYKKMGIELMSQGLIDIGSPTGCPECPDERPVGEPGSTTPRNPKDGKY